MPNEVDGALWAQWTHDAMNRYVMPDDVKDAEELADDMADISCEYADMMLAEYKERFAGGAKRRRRRGRGEDEREERDRGREEEEQAD